MQRLYQYLIENHFEQHQQMLFLAGPRQVGKTTLSLMIEQQSDRFLYLNWDNDKHRKIILEGEDSILKHLKFAEASPKKAMLILDELHKYKYWKRFLKGFYDLYKSDINIIVTGSAKLNIYKSGGDSLMGRYLMYRIHPLTIAELLANPITEDMISTAQKIDEERVKQLYELGGYPEPFIKNNKQFAKQWRQLRHQQLIREEIRDLSQVQDLAHLEILAKLLNTQVGQLVNYTNLASAIRVSVDTIRRWMDLLESIYYCFTIRPWSKNVKRSLIKEPKVYLWDWAAVKDEGARLENFVASHLLKAVNLWSDCGFGEIGLYFLRDKEKREVDFLVVKNDEPWFLVEVKTSDNQGISKSLYHFQQETQAKHAFQLANNKAQIDINCFEYTQPVIVPLVTFLSQLI